MMMLANLLALVLVSGEPSTPTAGPSVTVPHLSRYVGPGEIWNLTLKEAFRIGLNNSEVVRVCPADSKKVSLASLELAGLNAGSFDRDRWSDHPTVFIEQWNADAGIWQFKAAIMAHLRSIEQQYWVLSQLQVSLWSRETAVKLGEEILKTERDELAAGRATTADVAEAEQQLENFKLNLLGVLSDMITTERQLRNILGLPPADDRRIVASTAPNQSKVEPTWESIYNLMLTSQPDIAEQRKLIAETRRVAAARSLETGTTAEAKEAAWTQVERQRGFLQQVVHQTTHSLARFHLEVDASYKQFQKAQQMRAASQQRLEAQRAFSKEGRITIDRLLDAVSQYANAIAQEAQYLSTYNTSIAALEEAKGTLLGFDGVVIIEPTQPRDSRPAPVAISVTPKVDQVVQAKFDGLPSLGPIPATPTTYKVRARLGGMPMLEVEVEVHKATTGPITPPVH